MEACSIDKEGKLAEILGIDPSTLSTWKARNRIDWPLVFAKCQGVSIDWLLTGEGPMRRGEAAGPAPAEGEYCYIPHLAVGASAGHGALVEAEEIDKYLAFKSSWVHNSLRANPGDLFALNVQGDSMGDEVRDKDTILVNRTKQRLLHGKIYLLTVGETLLVKRYALTPEGPMAVSEEKSVYLPIPLRPDEYTVHGQVVWVGRVLA